MACGGCLECLLKLLNFLLTISGLAMVGYGIYLLVEWKRVSEINSISPDNSSLVIENGQKSDGEDLPIAEYLGAASYQQTQDGKYPFVCAI